MRVAVARRRSVEPAIELGAHAGQRLDEGIGVRGLLSRLCDRRAGLADLMYAA